MKVSKEEKKRLKKQYQKDLQESPEICFVVSSKISSSAIETNLIAEFQKVGLNVELLKSESEEDLYVIRQKANHQNHVTLKLSHVDHELIDEVSELECLMDTPIGNLAGKRMVIMASQVRLTEVNDLLLTTSIRCMGRLFQGIFINSNSIMDDWISWSLDYSGPTMAEVQRVYDEECPDFSSVLASNPDLVFRQSWWKRILTRQ